MKSFFRTGGFTIIELLIAILISFIVISGFSYFVIQLNDEIQSASDTSEMYTSLTSFIQKMNNISKDYASYQIIQPSNTDTYGNVLFTNTGATTGTLLWVAYKNSLTGKYSVDNPSNFYYYSDKNLFLQTLSSSQIAAIKADQNYIYTMNIQSDAIFSPLIVNKFRVTQYGSGPSNGTILDFSLNLYRQFDSAYEWVDIRDISMKKSIDVIPINLVF